METATSLRYDPPPGQMAADVLALGYMHAVLDHSGGKRIVHAAFANAAFERALALPFIRDINASLAPTRAEEDLPKFIEQFMKAVKAYCASHAGSADIRTFLAAIRAGEQTYALTHPIGIGIAAIYLYEWVK